MGGYDIFKTTLSETGLWSKPENIGYPINTPDDDVFFVMAPEGKIAYYSAIRERGIGGKDIYKVIYLGAEKDMMLSGEDQLIAGLQKPHDAFPGPISHFRQEAVGHEREAVAQVAAAGRRDHVHE